MDARSSWRRSPELSDAQNDLSCGTYTEMDSRDFQDLDDHAPWPSLPADIGRVGRLAVQVELENLTQSIREVGIEQSRRSGELSTVLSGLSADLTQSDERVAAVEASLLRAREENNQLIGYLEEVFSRISALDVRFESVNAVESALDEHPQRAELDELRTDIEDGIAVSREAQLADLERLELRLASLPTTDDVIELISRSDARIVNLGRSEDITKLQASVDLRLRDLAGEHAMTRELATTTTSLSVALTARLKEQEEGLAERVSEQFRTIQSEVEDSLADARRSHMEALEEIELRLAGLPTTEDVLALGADIDLRMSDLARADDVEDRYRSLEDSTTKRVSLLRAELLGALTEARESQTNENRQLEISLDKLPSTEDVVAISSRLDEVELLVSVRAMKQVDEVREELKTALETTRNEYMEKVAQLETVVGRIDQRIDDLGERTEQPDVLAEPAKPRIGYAPDIVLETQADLQDVDELHGRPVEEPPREAGGEDSDSDAWFNRKTFFGD